MSVVPNTQLNQPSVRQRQPKRDAAILVDGYFALRQLADAEGTWIVQERHLERLACGRQIERLFVKCSPRSLDEALDWLAAKGVAHAILLQMRRQLTPESQRLRLVP